MVRISHESIKQDIKQTRAVELLERACDRLISANHWIVAIDARQSMGYAITYGNNLPNTILNCLVQVFDLAISFAQANKKTFSTKAKTVRLTVLAKLAREGFFGGLAS